MESRADGKFDDRTSSRSLSSEDVKTFRRKRERMGWSAKVLAPLFYSWSSRALPDRPFTISNVPYRLSRFDRLTMLLWLSLVTCREISNRWMPEMAKSTKDYFHANAPYSFLSSRKFGQGIAWPVFSFDYIGQGVGSSSFFSREVRFKSSGTLTWTDCRKKMPTFWPRGEADDSYRLNKTPRLPLLK